MIFSGDMNDDEKNVIIHMVNHLYNHIQTSMTQFIWWFAFELYSNKVRIYLHNRSICSKKSHVL